MSHDPYKAAKKKVKAKKGFYGHLSVYLAINIIMTTVVYLSGDGLNWLMVAMLWGISLLIHFFFAIGLPGIGAFNSKEWEENEIRKEMRKRGYVLKDEDMKNELDLGELRRAPRDYRDEDFV